MVFPWPNVAECGQPWSSRGRMWPRAESGRLGGRKLVKVSFLSEFSIKTPRAHLRVELAYNRPLGFSVARLEFSGGLEVDVGIPAGVPFADLWDRAPFQALIEFL